jgi:hypothetical protein
MENKEMQAKIELLENQVIFLRNWIYQIAYPLAPMSAVEEKQNFDELRKKVGERWSLNVLAVMEQVVDTLTQRMLVVFVMKHTRLGCGNIFIGDLARSFYGLNTTKPVEE